ncbi:hypothetical protein LY474_38010 [Myxococcus stipitatus]|uniref:hypothetical protein n=1 Tax=Myxococcus stipitatus TaxID=83455 RepID=UPI001F426BE1|nr:hypothetical protein [Myxococcus stipitatus]MCE9673616.1 hypothetical protein [Myxococcus stipitatus]
MSARVPTGLWVGALVVALAACIDWPEEDEVCAEHPDRCGADGGSSDGGADGGDGGRPTGGDDAGPYVQVKVGRRYVGAAGELGDEGASSSQPPQVFQLDDAGSPLPIPPESVGLGGFSFQAPPGLYYVRHGARHAVTTSRSVDLAETRWGRPPGDTTGATTLVGVDMTELGTLAPWLVNDRLELVLPALSRWGRLDFGFFGPQVGSTSLGEIATKFVPALADDPWLDTGDLEDTGWLVQQHARSATPVDGGSPIAYLSIATAGEAALTGFQDERVLVSAALDPTVSRQVTVDWNRPAFQAHAPQGFASVTADSRFTLEVLPYGAKADLVPSPLLLELAQDATGSLSALRLQPTYGNPYPSAWPVTANFSYRFSVTTKGADWTTGEAAVTLQAEVARVLPLAAVTSPTPVPVAPEVLPPRDFKVDAQAASQSRLLSSDSPVLSWTAPAQGNVSHYVVTVLHVSRSLPGWPYAAAEYASFVLDGDARELRLPSGLLESGHYYALRLGAHAAPQWSPARPYRLPQEFSRAETLSGVLRAP